LPADKKSFCYLCFTYLKRSVYQVDKGKDILIIGAGSTGLSSALFLSDLGFKPRIIDKRKEPARITKALGVNPNTLKLFERNGITSRFLENGNKVSCFNFWCKNRLVYKNDFSKVNHPYPYMLVQPQFETEAIMEAALSERGILVERGVAVEDIAVGEHAILITLKDTNGNAIPHDHNGIILGADGHKSRLRESMGVAFNGWEHTEEFVMYDIELQTPISHNEGHYLFYKEGGMLMLHIRDGVWRVGGNIKDVLNYLPKGSRTGRISWETTFTIREKVAATFSKGNVFLLGDAAHIHSPAGAKGMNLCIEDSFIFAQLLQQGQEQKYSDGRRSEIRKAVNILSQLTDKVGGHNLVGNTIRSNFDKLSIFFPLIMPRMRKFLLGIK
jgi:2-polyprenyl-6-methoxyphenol hydroxylase-like FAD-dependent oxidoreductase